VDGCSAADGIKGWREGYAVNNATVGGGDLVGVGV